MEIRNPTIALILIQCVGDPSYFLKHKKWPEFLPPFEGAKSAFFFTIKAA